MSLYLKTIYNALFGAWAGLLAWLLLDVLLKLNPESVWLDAALNGAVVGMCIGALINTFSSLLARQWWLFARSLVVGLLTGVIGGVFGLLIGEGAFQGGQQISKSLLLQESFRAIGWVIFGIGIGVTEGVLTFSLRRALYGGIGGVIGGLLSGAVFIVVTRVSNLALTNRAVGFVILGAFIGFFVALVPVVLSQAVLKVVSIKGEGTEFIVDKQVTTIGGADRNDVFVGGEPSFVAKHAEIRQEKNQFVLYALPGCLVTVNNDVPITRQALQDNDRVKFGRVEMVFRRKGK